MNWHIQRYDEIRSTNDVAVALIRTGGAVGGEVFVARAQTAGRGRVGRDWRSDVGGLWMTAVLPVREPLPGSGLAAGLAVCRTAARFGALALLKWPNDVEVLDRKLAGVLVEHIAGCPLFAVGIGVNIANRVGHLTDLRRPAVSLAEALGREIAPDDVLEPLLAELDAVWSMWAEQDWPALLGEIRRWDGSAGRRVRAGDGAWTGTATGPDADGALIVRADDGTRRRVDAGEVEFL